MIQRKIAVLLLILGLLLGWPAAGQAPRGPGPSPAAPTPEEMPGEEPTPAGEGTPAEEVPPAPAGPGIWIADSDNGRIVYVEDMQGTGFRAFGFPGRGLGHLLHPEQVWVDSRGRVYVADRGNDRIVRLDDLTGRGWAEISGLSQPRGVATCGDRIYAADTGNDRILVYRDLEGEPLQVYRDARVRHPLRLWPDSEGNLYVTCGEDPPGGRLVYIPRGEGDGGKNWKVYKGQGLNAKGFGPAQAATVGSPIYLVNPSTHRLARIGDMEGRVARELGGYGSGRGRFLRPSGLALDSRGRIYVADTGNDRIVRMDGIDGSGWTVFRGGPDPRTLLRGPRSVFVWAPGQAVSEEGDGGDG